MQVTKGTWRMREQCVPGSLSSSYAREPGNEASMKWNLQTLSHSLPSYCHLRRYGNETGVTYTKQLYERIYKQTRIKRDPQVFLGMAARAQTVDTRPFFFLFFERPGYEAKMFVTVFYERFRKVCPQSNTVVHAMDDVLLLWSLITQ